MIRMKRTVSIVITLIFVLSLVLTGCGANKSTGTATPAPTTTAAASTDQPTATPTPDPMKDLPPIDLTFYFPNTPQKDLASVENELNKAVKAKINATIHLKLTDWSAYDEKMKVIMASGESYDLAFTSTWTNNFYQNVANGAFAPLDDLIAKYAPTVKSDVVPEIFWRTVKVKGQTFGVPNFQQATAGYGYLIQKTIADKYKLDWKSVNKLSDLTPFLETVKKSEPNLIPFGLAKGFEPFNVALPMFGMEALGDAMTPGTLYLNDTNLKVINQYESPEFKDYVTMMRDWYKKGYLRQDVATLKDNVADQKAGKNAMSLGQIDIGSEDFEAAGLPFKGRMSSPSPAIESYDHKFVKPILTTDKAAASIIAISANSPNKERAMMFINLLNTDKQIYNILDWGVENKHYKKVSDNRIELIKDSGYSLYSGWEFGYMGQAYYSDSDAKGAEVDDKGNKLWENLNKNAIPSNALGFVFDFTPVKSEKANTDQILAELYDAIATGSVDPVKFLPQFIEKLKNAGADKIIQEKQRQLDAWKAANK